MIHRTQAYAERRSGVELLKIIAIFLVVISHVTQTLGVENTDVSFQDYVLLVGNATTDTQVLILTLMMQAGKLGNAIFFVCSAWFLVGKTGKASKKAISLLCTVWCISVLVLCLYLAMYPSHLPTMTVIRQILPTTFANNWYVSCYIIFLFIYPWLNRLIAIIDQRQLLEIVVFSTALWIVADYLGGDLFFSSALILWVTIYFLVAYLKLYCTHAMANTRVGTVLLTVGILGYVAQVLVTNFVGLYLFSSLSDDLLHWSSDCNPFNLMIAIGSLIIALQSSYKNKTINYISGLTLTVYLLHENFLFRRYTRPAIWQYLYNTFGYAHVVALDLAFAAVLFLASVVVSAIYRETLQRLVTKASDKLYALLAGIYGRMERALLKIK